MRNLLFLISVVASSAALGCELKLDSGWIRAAPPGAMMLAGYVNIKNAGSEPLQVTAAHSAAFDSVELHETVEKEGVSRMREIKSLALPAAATVTFAPGGKHLMLIGPKSPLKVGDVVQIAISAGKSCTVNASFVVRAGAPESSHDHHSHHH